MIKKRPRSNQMEFRELWQELRAINLWDRQYEDTDSHDFIETFAWEARRRRFLEILEQIICLNTDAISGKQGTTSVTPRSSRNF